MIINIRGTSGSGKTTVVREIMSLCSQDRGGRDVQWPWSQALADSKVIGYTHQDWKIFVTGKYTTACGGCDTIKTQKEVKDLILEWAGKGYHVIYEGLLISTIYEPWLEFARLRETHNYLNILPEHHDVLGKCTCGAILHRFVFLNTSLKECMARVTQRRAASGNVRPINWKLTEDKFKTIYRIEGKLKQAGADVVSLASTDAAKEILTWLV